MIIEAVVCDDKGEPFTKERFQCEPEAAQQFLELLESNSYRLLKDWRGMSNEEILLIATARLNAIEQDLVTAEFLKSKDLIQ